MKSEQKQAARGQWKNRIVGHGRMDPRKLAAHPKNYKAHPDAQRGALDAAIREVGFIRSVTVNRATGVILDGHLRVALAIEKGQRRIPVEFVNLTRAQEAVALAALDPIASMADVDADALAKLIDKIEADTPDLAKALRGVEDMPAAGAAGCRHVCHDRISSGASG